MSADASATAEDAEAPLPATERIVALDVLRGFALLGIFIMNMPGFSHSIFAAPAPTTGTLDGAVAFLRTLLFAGKFNLLFGLLFGVGFAIQMARLGEAERARAARLGEAPRAQRATHVYVRRLAFLFVVGTIHAMLLWPGDVLLVYATLGFALLALRRVSDRVLVALIGACLLYPALSDVVRARWFADFFETIAAFQYQQLQASNDLAYGHGRFADAVRETARVFDWSWRSPLGVFNYLSFAVQMATGILVGFVLGRRGWPASTAATSAARRLRPRRALALAVACGVVATIAGAVVGGSAGIFVQTLAGTLGRAGLAACYALAVVAFVERRATLPRWLAPLRDAGRMPLSNYLLQTALASAVFYGWGLGVWNSVGAAFETALALVLFVAVQLPLSAWWLRRFRLGPLEYLWRLFTYGRA